MEIVMSLNETLPSNTVGDFFLTVDNSYQYCRKILDKEYEFTKILWLDGADEGTKSYIVLSDTINVGTMTVNEIEIALSCFYSSLEDFINCYNYSDISLAEFFQLIAECAFENASYDNSVSPVMSFEECVKFQKQLMLSHSNTKNKSVKELIMTDAEINTNCIINANPLQRIVQIAESLGWEAYTENVLEDHIESDDDMWFIGLTYKTLYDTYTVRIYANFEKEFMQIFRDNCVCANVDKRAIELYKRYGDKPLIDCYGISKNRYLAALHLYSALVAAGIGGNKL